MIRYVRQRVRDVRSAPAIVLAGLVLRAAATGLLAMGVTGIIFIGIRYRLGDAALAADADRAPLSAERCNDLLAQYPEQPDCYSAETAHHADEALQVRFGAAALGVLALAGFGAIAWRSGAWRRRSRGLDLMALATFGLLVRPRGGRRAGTGIRRAEARG